MRGGSRVGLVRDDGRHALAAVLKCLDGALADDEGDREEESGRGDADHDDERLGGFRSFVVIALRAVITLQKT